VNLPAPIHDLTEADYLAGEAAAEVRHDCVAGRVFAMAAAIRAHAALSLNIAFRGGAHCPYGHLRRRRGGLTRP
jgi:hypothetical protein